MNIKHKLGKGETTHYASFWDEIPEKQDWYNKQKETNKQGMKRED